MDIFKIDKNIYFCGQDSNKFIENKIFKRTNRGRKEKISLPKDILKCEICLKYFFMSNEKFIINMLKYYRIMRIKNIIV